MNTDATVWMNRAAEIAWKGVKSVQSNPMVGAVLVKEGIKIGEGYHAVWGGLHAETAAIEAAKQAGHSLKGATLYVTLEPCCHQGKQGPCTQAILKEGIARVVFAQTDPNPLMQGKGKHQLEQVGIQVDEGSTWDTRELNAIYLKNQREKRPFVHLKTACTIEGKITLKKNTETPLGGTESMAIVHRWRARYDAILVGRRTVEIDDPRLTARMEEGTNPLRILLDSHLQIPSSSQAFQQPGKTILATLMKSSPTPYPGDTEIWTLPPNPAGTIELNALMETCFHHGIRSVLVEGGESVNTAFLQENLVDRVTVIETPHRVPTSENLNDLPNVYRTTEIPHLEFIDSQWTQIGKDFWRDGFTKKQN